MKNVFKSPKTYMVAGLVLIVVTASAWQLKDKKQHHDTTTANNYADADTTKPRKHGNDKDDYGVRDNDDLNININLDGLDTTINQVVHDALKSVNVNAIVNQAMQSVKEIDWHGINDEIQQSLKEAQHEIDNIDTVEINREIHDAQQEIKNEHIIDSAEINRIVRDALRNVKISINNQRRI